MTIVAGFKVRNGILLAADTMYTGGAKVHQPKLFGYTPSPDTEESATLGFALAGHEDFGKMAIEDCVEAIASCPPPDRSIDTVRKLLRRAVKTINDEYVDKKPASEREAARFELLIAAWLPNAGGLRLFRTRGSAVNDSGNYYCTGFGAYLGDYLMRNIFTPEMRLRDAALLAIQALGAAKTYDANCGGDTQFMTIYEGGKISGVTPFNVSSSEAYISEFENLSRKLLFSIGDSEMDDKAFETWLQSFADEMRRIRAFWKGKGFDYMAERFSRFTVGGQQGPQPPKADP
jgi:20S proteasome alpha/beta subunit